MSLSIFGSHLGGVGWVSTVVLSGVEKSVSVFYFIFILFKEQRVREKETVMFSWLQLQIPRLLSPSCFSSHAWGYDPRKYCANPRTLLVQILIFPWTWSLPEYLLWLTILTFMFFCFFLIKARHFFSCSVWFIVYSRGVGLCPLLGH